MDIVIALILLACPILAGITAAPKHRLAAILLGLFLGPLGLIIALLTCRERPQPAHLMAAIPSFRRDTLSAPSPLADIPSHLTIRRDGHILGTWPLEDVLTYLNDGTLLPTDHYLHTPATSTWRLLQRLT